MKGCFGFFKVGGNVGRGGDEEEEEEEGYILACVSYIRWRNRRDDAILSMSFAEVADH